MAETAEPGAALPEVEVRSRRGIPIVWVIPFVALLVGAWLTYTTLTERGPEITVTFLTAAGLEAGKTQVKYRDVQLGVVGTVALSADGTHIVVNARLDKGAESHLTGGTKFWVVRPRLTTGGVSGLSTLVSGAYIELEPGQGPPAREFVGLEVPPVVRAHVAGRKFQLRSNALGSLNPGSPVTYRGIDVGEVLGYQLDDDGIGITIFIFVKAPHFRLVRNNSRFWNASGIDVSVGADGVNVSTGSLEALLTGGVAFDTPVSGADVDPAPENTRFTLFDNLTNVTDASYTEKIAYIAYFDGSVHGLNIGAPVEFRGIRVGSVTDVRLEIDPTSATVRIPVTFQIEPQRVDLPEMGMGQAQDPHSVMTRLVNRGLRAQLESASLVTGRLLLALDFHPDSPPAALVFGDTYPVVPTVPTDFDVLAHSVEEVLIKIASLPLEPLIEDLRRTAQGANRLVAGPEILQAMASLQSTLTDLQTLTADVKRLVSNVDKETVTMLTSITSTAQAAEKTMAQARSTLAGADNLIGDKSDIRHDTTVLLKELTEAARSIRFLADYLEQHPEALLRGKTGVGN